MKRCRRQVQNIPAMAHFLSGLYFRQGGSVAKGRKISFAWEKPQMVMGRAAFVAEAERH
jgi:hypothetical protein